MPIYILKTMELIVCEVLISVVNDEKSIRRWRITASPLTNCQSSTSSGRPAHGVLNLHPKWLLSTA